MKYSIKNEILNVEISSLGAEIQSIQKQNVEYLWQGDEKSWKNKATNIFPIVGRLLNGKYTFDGETYELGSHGLARHFEFLTEDISENKITFKMESNENTLKNYPFNFCYYITYEIINNELFITSKLENKDNKNIYFAIGGHPGFNVPLKDGLNITDYYIEFSENKSDINCYTINKEGLVTGKKPFKLENDKILRLNNEMFSKDALIFENISKVATLKTDKDDKSVCVKYNDMDYLAFWQSANVKPDFLCIEPWTSLPSRENITEDLSTFPTLLCLEKGKIYKNVWSIVIN